MYKSLLNASAAFALFLIVSVHCDDLSHVHDFCLTYLSKEKSDTKTSSDEQGQGDKSKKCSVSEETTPSMIQKFASLEKTVAELKERLDFLTWPVCHESFEATLSYSSYNDTARHCPPSPTPKYWCPKEADKEPWIQIALPAPQTIRGVGTGGSFPFACLMLFSLACGNSTDDLQQINDEGVQMIFHSGHQARTTRHALPPNVVCQYIRLYPEEWCPEKVMSFSVYAGECNLFEKTHRVHF